MTCPSDQDYWQHREDEDRASQQEAEDSVIAGEQYERCVALIRQAEVLHDQAKRHRSVGRKAGAL